MRKILFISLLLVSFCYCQLNGKFWWTDSRVAKFNKVNIPEPIIEDISPFETDESAKIVFRDEFPFETSGNLKPIYNSKFVFNTTPDICHYVKKKECHGIIYSTKYGKSVNKGPRDPQLVCCLEAPRKPLKDDSKIYFPGFRSNNNNYINHVSKRSVKNNKKRPSRVHDSQIDYDEDPYWNIKNSNFHNSQNSQKDDIAYDESVDEIPKPGLIGIYSDDGKRPDWSVQDQSSSSAYDGGFEYDDVDDTPSFGYSPIDPRRETKTTKRKLKPLKLQTPSEETPYDPRAQTISYQSNPDFKVFEGFKLLNLAKINENRPEEINNNDPSKEILFNKPLESSTDNSEEYFSSENEKVFNDCGKSVQIKEKDQRRGDASVGSHPWLAMVIQTRRRNTFLCYATLIHPRAAVTIASCVDNKTSPGELTLIAGMQYPNRRSRTSSRISQVILHPDYTPGDLANDLALLIWQVALKLTVNIQPACLADPGSGKDCMFFGWGGLRSGIRSQSRWQRGKIRACTNRISSMKGEKLPRDSFCVSVEPRHSIVTGLGGPLICNVNGLNAVVGVIVTNRPAPILIPVQDWAMQYADIINEEA